MGIGLLSRLCVATVLFFYQYGYKLYFSTTSFGQHIILMNDSISRLCILYEMRQDRSYISEWTTNWHQQLKTVWTFCGAWKIFLSHNFLYMNAYLSTILESQIFFLFGKETINGCICLLYKMQVKIFTLLVSDAFRWIRKHISTCLPFISEIYSYH